MTAKKLFWGQFLLYWVVKLCTCPLVYLTFSNWFYLAKICIWQLQTFCLQKVPKSLCNDEYIATSSEKIQNYSIWIFKQHFQEAFSSRIMNFQFGLRIFNLEKTFSIRSTFQFGLWIINLTNDFNFALVIGLMLINIFRIPTYLKFAFKKNEHNQRRSLSVKKQRVLERISAQTKRQSLKRLDSTISFLNVNSCSK